MSTSISGEIGSTVMSTIYDELNKAIKIIIDLEEPSSKSSLEKMDVLKMMFQGDSLGSSSNKVVEHYKFKVVTLAISDRIKSLLKQKMGVS